jgi:hypothetical protein
MRAPLLITLALLGAPAYAADEPSGCDKFKWPIERERAALTAPNRPRIASGADLNPALPVAAVISLRPSAEANLPTTPERKPAANTFPDMRHSRMRFRRGGTPSTYPPRAGSTWCRTDNFSGRLHPAA